MGFSPAFSLGFLFLWWCCKGWNKWAREKAPDHDSQGL
jgi:hypothetical protein